ncbi:uncharacterized protein LOC135694084 [Rhopilema esculentum]|uniref:uncharacterized protein LOC135694084 n=1 Tax=Rhopilema esculentum TaxID=499914 RepID=UPI0031D1197A
MHAYRSDLYGPERQARYQFIKGLNLKDSVLQKGDYNQRGNNWETHYNSIVKDVFAREESLRKKDGSSFKTRPGAHQNSHVFGQDLSYKYDLTSRDYGMQNRRVSPIKGNIDREIHIVDFCPKYYNIRNFDTSSMYHYSYNNNGKLPFDQANRAETQARTKDVRLTHFNLGSCKEKLSTETSDSYKQDSCSQETSQSLPEPTNQKSNIFKSGDWNDITRNTVKNSVTAGDFINAEQSNKNGGHTRSFGKSVKKSLADLPDYVKTHIEKSGHMVTGTRTSLYKKDFLTEKDESIKQRYVADAPPSSIVFPRDGSSVKFSTNKSDFLSFSKEIEKMDRSIDLTRNKMRNAENHLKPTIVSNKRSGSSSLTTITRNSYLKPIEDSLTTKHETAPLSKYRYLDSDAALLKPRYSPLISEAKSQHTAKPVSRCLRSSVTDAEKQLLEDKATHFALGTDLLRYKTEHTSQFNQPLGLDTKYPAAGLRSSGSAKYKKFQSKNVKEDHLENLGHSSDVRVNTVMQEDYKPIEIRGFTDYQQRLISNLEKYPPRIARSHLFHLDNSTKGPLMSRTKTDFIDPAGNHKY